MSVRASMAAAGLAGGVVGLGCFCSPAAAGTWSAVAMRGSLGTSWSASVFGGHLGSSIHPPGGTLWSSGGTHSTSLSGTAGGPISGDLSITVPAAGSPSHTTPLIVQWTLDNSNTNWNHGQSITAGVELDAYIAEHPARLYVYIDWVTTVTTLSGNTGGGGGQGGFSANVANPGSDPLVLVSSTAGVYSGAWEGYQDYGRPNEYLFLHATQNLFQGQFFGGHTVVQTTMRIYLDTVPVVPAPGAGLATLAGLGIVSRRRR